MGARLGLARIGGADFAGGGDAHGGGFGILGGGATRIVEDATSGAMGTGEAET